jgi:hypothetical protein
MSNNPHANPKASEEREGLAEEFEERLNAFLESNVRCHGMSPWPWFPWLTVNAPAILAALRKREAMAAALEDAIAAEREACAKIAETAYVLMYPRPRNRITAENAGHMVARTIRSRVTAHSSLAALAKASAAQPADSKDKPTALEGRSPSREG